MLFDTARAGFVAPMSLFLIDSVSSSTYLSSLNLFSSPASDISLIFIADSVVLMTQTILPSFLTIIHTSLQFCNTACLFYTYFSPDKPPILYRSTYFSSPRLYLKLFAYLPLSIHPIKRK